MGVVRSGPVAPSAAALRLLTAPAIGLSLAFAGLATLKPHVPTSFTRQVLSKPAATLRWRPPASSYSRTSMP